jgi:hypothetical protein
MTENEKSKKSTTTTASTSGAFGTQVPDSQLNFLQLMMTGVIVAFFTVFIALAFAYIQFVITESNDRADIENQLIDKIREQNYKIDILLQNQNKQP